MVYLNASSIELTREACNSLKELTRLEANVAVTTVTNTTIDMIAIRIMFLQLRFKDL